MNVVIGLLFNILLYVLLGLYFLLLVTLMIIEVMQ